MTRCWCFGAPYPQITDVSVTCHDLGKFKIVCIFDTLCFHELKSCKRESCSRKLFLTALVWILVIIFNMDPRSLLLLNKLITLAEKNMHKVRPDVDYDIKTKISTILAKSEAMARLARYYYTVCMTILTADFKHISICSFLLTCHL